VWAGAPVQAATVQLCGPGVCYEYDDTQAALALFNAPSLLSGTDIVEFLPSTFRAESNDGVGIHSGTNTDTVTASFVFSRVWSKSGAEISSVFAQESGDYNIAQAGNVSATLFLQGVDLVNDTGIGSFPFGPFPEKSINTSAFSASGDTGSVVPLPWQLAGAITPAADWLDTANDLSLTIQNTLLAFTNAAGDRAFIEKKLVLTVGVVPLPAAVWLFASGLGLAGWVRRKGNH